MEELRVTDRIAEFVARWALRIGNVVADRAHPEWSRHAGDGALRRRLSLDSLPQQVRQARQADAQVVPTDFGDGLIDVEPLELRGIRFWCNRIWMVRR